MPSTFDDTPSLPLAIVATSTFGIVTCYHAFLMTRHRTLVFWTMFLAMLMEVIAFGLRAYSLTHPEEFVGLQIFIVLSIISPSIAGISLMTLFSRVTWYTTPAFKSKYRMTWLPTNKHPYKPFVAAYTSSLLLTAISGAALASSDSSDQEYALETILPIALITQMVCLATITIVIAMFTHTSRRQAWTPSALLSTTIPPKSYHTFLLTILASSTLLTLCTIYRVMEFWSFSLSSVSSYLQSQEYLFYICDVLPMLVTFVLFAYVHPSQALPREYTVLWFNPREVRLLEKKMLESQEWTGNVGVPAQELSGDGMRDVERQDHEQYGKQRQSQVAELGTMEGKDMVTVMCQNVTPPSGTHPPARN